MSDTRMDRLIAVVTGASRGIGRAIARRLAERWEVVAVARSSSELDDLAREIAQDGGACRTIPLDITDRHAVDRELKNIAADVLVNNAGVGTLRPFLELEPDDWHRMVDVNFNSLYYVTRALLPSMVERRTGFILNVGSLAGRNSFVGGTCYAATKHAVMGFTESLMLEVRESGVRVSVLMPGSVATEFFPDGTETSWMLTPEQVAEVVWFTVTQPAASLLARVELRVATPPRKN